jgi:hypothetical protein
MTYFRVRSHINSNSFGVVPLRRATIPRAAMHSDQPLLQSTHAVEERREATDGELYTKFEFMNYYGNEAGLQLWNENERTDQPLLQSTDGAEERRVAFDRALYTYSDFTTHYGADEGSQFWNECGTPFDVATDQPLLQSTAAQSVITTVADVGDTTEHIARADGRSTAPGLQLCQLPGPQAAATEHSAPAILEVSELPAIRKAENAIIPKRSLHGLARGALNDFADAAAHDESPKCLDDLFPWKAYVAFKDYGARVVGPGISRAVVDQIKDVKDPNRGGRPRVDFILYRVDGSAFRLHPGTKPNGDAAPVYCPPSPATEQTATCVWHARPILSFTYEQAKRIPQIDKLGKKEALEALQTEPDKFKWWLFAANLGRHTEDVIGNGITSAELVEHSDTNARLRFQHQDRSTVEVEILRRENGGLDTRLHM